MNEGLVGPKEIIDCSVGTFQIGSKKVQITK